MKTNVLYLFLSCVLLSVVGCIPKKTITGDGNIVTETISITDYDQLEIEGGGIVVDYTQADIPSALQIKTDQNIFEKYEFKLEENKLKIRPKKEFRRNTNLRPTEFTITTNSQRLTKIAGGGAITFNANSPLKAEEMEAEMAGAGLIQFNDTATFTKLKVDMAGSGEFKGMMVYAQEMEGEMAGSSTFNLGGNIKKVDFDIAGSGRVNAYDCTFDHLKCNIAGSGDICATITTSINAKVAGSGSIRYKGDPQEITKSVLGSGNIEKVD